MSSGYQPIEDYGVIGNLRTAALVARWQCAMLAMATRRDQI